MFIKEKVWAQKNHLKSAFVWCKRSQMSVKVAELKIIKSKNIHSHAWTYHILCRAHTVQNYTVRTWSSYWQWLSRTLVRPVGKLRMTMNLQYLGTVGLYYSSPWSNSEKKDRCGIRKIGSNFVECDKIFIIKLLYLSQIIAKIFDKSLANSDL